MASDPTTLVIAARVNQSRFLAGVSVRRLAGQTGLSRSTLTQKLKGKTEFKASELIRVGLVLGIPAEDWLVDLPARAA